MTPEQVDAVARGEGSWWEWGRDLPTRLSPQELGEYEAAKARGYLIRRAGLRERLEFIYGRWCSAARRPYLRARCRRVTAQVVLDLLPADMKLPADGAALAAARRILARLPHRRASVWWGTQCMWVDPAPVALVPEMAAELRHLAARAVPVPASGWPVAASLPPGAGPMAGASP